MSQRKKDGLMARLALLALSARQGNGGKILYPTTMRECRNGGVNHHLNHNVYAFDGSRKIPMRVRYGEQQVRGHSPDILALSFSGLVRSVGRQLYARRSPSDVVRYIKRETEDLPVGRLGRDFLDGMTQEVHQRIAHFRGTQD